MASVALTTPFTTWGVDYDVVGDIQIYDPYGTWPGMKGVATADFDGDGHDDVLATGSGTAAVLSHATLAGATFVDSNTSASLWITGVGGSQGAFVADLDDDGSADDVVFPDAEGSPVFRGSTLAAAWGGGLLDRESSATWILDGFEVNWGSAAALGDIDGDEVQDILVTATGVPGQLAVVFNRSLDTDVWVDLDHADRRVTLPDYAGGIVTTADFDGDGIDDVAIGSSPYYSTCIVSGDALDSVDEFCSLGLTISYTAAGTGAWVGAGGDVDGDGLPELLMSDGYESASLFWGGRLYVIDSATMSGFSGALVPESLPMWVDGGGEVYNLSDGDYWSYGPPASAAEDVDLDGRHDVMVVAPNAPTPTGWSGEAYLFLGSDLAAGGHIDTDAAAASFYNSYLSTPGIRSVGFVGDLNEDGFADPWFFAPDGGSSLMIAPS